MKVVDEESQLENLFLTAKSEAKKFFNNDELYIEKPSKGKKMSRKEFDSKVSGAVENLKSGNKN